MYVVSIILYIWEDVRMEIKKPNADVSASGSFCDYKFKIVYLIHNTSRSKEDCSNRLLLS